MNGPVIVGAGPAGLTAGYLFAGRGARPLVLESENQVGGLAKTVIRDGYRLDRLHALPLDPQPVDSRAEADLASVALDRVRHRLPHLPRPVARIVEAADQAAAAVAMGLGAP